MKIVELPVWYRDTTDMRAAGQGALASLIDAVGLPLELVHVTHDRVLNIESLDYEEGREKPLARHVIWWFDTLEAAPQTPVSVIGAIIAVYPDGSRHTWVSL